MGPVVNITGMESTVRQYINRFRFHYPNAHFFVDPKGAAYWQLSAFPTILFYNRQDRLVQRVDGALTEPQLSNIVRQLLNRGA